MPINVTSTLASDKKFISRHKKRLPTVAKHEQAHRKLQ